MHSTVDSGISVVVPVYRGVKSLEALAGRLEAVFAGLRIPHELLFVDDCSPDGSWKLIEELMATRPWIRGFRLMRNFGQHNALLAGIRQARYDRIVTMDDDLQHPPEEIGKLLESKDCDAEKLERLKERLIVLIAGLSDEGR